MSIVHLQNLMCCMLFFLGFPRRKYFAARFFPLAALLAGALHIFSELFEKTNVFLFIYYLVEIGALMALYHFCFQTNWEQALYSACAGRATQHLIYQLHRLIRLKIDLFAWVPPGKGGEIIETILSYVPVCIVVYFIFARKMDTSHCENDSFRREMNLVSMVILLMCFGIPRFAKSSSSFLDGNTIAAQCLYAITCCLLCLIMQCELCKRAKLTKEMETVRMLWNEDSKRLAERKDMIESINIKCHDIRHKLEDYHLPLTNDEKSEIKSLIQIYDQTYRTGNRTLDILLADRALLCEKDHIQLSFMGDGSCLQFLTETEIYSLLGNAVGNAVEASRHLEEEKRQISMIIKSSGDLVSISVTNYYQGELFFEEGLPVTTRPDLQDFHGYGMKSMQAIVKKHDGRLKVRAENGVFELTIWLVNSTSHE